MAVAFALAVVLVAYNTVTNLRPSTEATYLVRNLVTGVLLVGIARAAGLSWGDLGLGADAVGAGWRWGRVAVIAVAVGVAAVAALAGRFPAVARLLSDRRADLPPRLLAYHVLVRIPVGTAAFEEVAFRGVLLGAFLATVPTAWAVVASSVAFGLWHLAPTRRSLEINDVRDPGDRRRELVNAVTATTVAGVVLSLLRLGSGSVLAPVLAHAAVNALGMLAAAVFQRTGGVGDR